MIRIILISLFFLGGCQTVINSEINQAQQNPWLEKAEQDVAMVIERGVEWRVRDIVTDNNPVNLSELLKIAQELQFNGDNTEAKRISVKISQLALLAIQQAEENENVFPKYAD